MVKLIGENRGNMGKRIYRGKVDELKRRGEEIYGRKRMVLAMKGEEDDGM